MIRGSLKSRSHAPGPARPMAAAAVRAVLGAGAARVAAAGLCGCGAGAFRASPLCTLAPLQQQPPPPAAPPDMKSYLWSHYKEAKKVTKGECGHLCGFRSALMPVGGGEPRGCGRLVKGAQHQGSPAGQGRVWARERCTGIKALLS